ncbi:DegT/DnrJ/EryC1/StrS family aminotransferase [Candidatus Dependentiae bacterium]|nr:DegT/DnrJ/EryC1/StrS family aminotransferase [Candidatus Dependentiae bacterium]
MKKIDNFIPLAKPVITDSEINSVVEVINSGFWTTGPKVKEFETQIINYLGNDLFCIALNSCTAGLFLSLKALNIAADDEVIVPTWTFAATAQVVEWAGAKLVLCDVEESSLNIDVDKLEKLITSKTKAIVPVHFAGYPCDMDRILNLANKYNLYVIEDAAHAIGSKYKNIKIGNFGDTTVFSFYATKNLACGEGGMVVSKNGKLIEKISKLSYFGINKSAFNRYTEKGNWYYEIEDLGYKFNFDDIHAAIALEQLKKIDIMNNRRREIAKYYKENLDSKITFIKDSEDKYHTYHLFPIILPGNINRDEFILKLKEMNIGASVHFIPLHKHPYYKKKYLDKHFPAADKIYPNILSIPMSPVLKDIEIKYIAEIINNLVIN